MTPEQAKQLQYHQEVHFGTCKRYVGPRGGVTVKTECWRVNGSVKVWKRDTSRFEVPIKYGFNGPYTYIVNNNVADFHLASECTPQVITADAA